MRSAYPLLPWFLILSICATSSCDDPFLVSECEFDPARPGCGSAMGADMAQPAELDGAVPADLGGMRDMVTPAPKPPVSFTLINNIPLTPVPGKPALMRNWVGIRPDNTIIFANQIAGMPANLEVYKLGKGNTATGWDLLTGACGNCPPLVNHVNFMTDYLLTSKTMLFAVSPQNIFSIKINGDISDTHINQNNLSNNFRPFLSPDFDGLIFQMKTTNNDLKNDNFTQLKFYDPPSGTEATASFTVRANIPYATVYALGNLDGQGKMIFIFESEEDKMQSLKFIYRLDDSFTATPEPGLTELINQKVMIPNGSPDNNPIRSAYISDLNKDGYMELIYSRGPQIYVTTYVPNADLDHKFIRWPSMNLKINLPDRTKTITASDLDGDGYPELAIETNNPHMVYFYLNNTK